MLPAPPSSAPGEAPLPSPPDAPASPHDPAVGPLRRSTATRRTTWALAGAAAAGCAYVAIADPNNTASWYPQCPFKVLTGYDCPGCGVTRALHALLTGHPLRAFDHNALVVVAAVLGVLWFATSEVRERRGRPPLRLKHPAVWSVAAGVLLVAFWLGRNVAWGPLRWLDAAASGA